MTTLEHDLSFPDLHEAAVAAEGVFRGSPFPRLSISMEHGAFSASTYWPKGEVGRDTFCHGTGKTIEAALDALAVKWAEAEASGKKLRTAAECKQAVIDLIREHGAAPASFRDAVDSLPVA